MADSTGQSSHFSPIQTNQPAPIKTVRIDIPYGCDIVETVQNFAREHRVGLHIAGGSGYICNFSLLNTSFLSMGVFKLVTLSGTFMDSTMIGTSCGSSTVGEFPCYLPTRLWLKATFLGAERVLLGGIMASKVSAFAGGVVVHAITFRSNEFEVLNPTEHATMEQRSVQHGGVGGESVGSSSSYPSRGGFGGGPLGGGGSCGVFGGGGR